MTQSALLALLSIGALPAANATTYTLNKADDTVVGQDQSVVTVYEDTLYALAAKYSLEKGQAQRAVDALLKGRQI